MLAVRGPILLEQATDFASATFAQFVLLGGFFGESGLNPRQFANAAFGKGKIWWWGMSVGDGGPIEGGGSEGDGIPVLIHI